MDQEQFDAIKERVEKATDGPWMFDKGLTERGDRRPAVITHFGEDGDEYIHGDVADINDAEFIAHAREDVPALVGCIAGLHELRKDDFLVLCAAKDEVRANQREIEQLREMLRGTRKTVRQKVSEVKTLQNACKKHKERQGTLEFHLKVSVNHAEELADELEALTGESND